MCPCGNFRVNIFSCTTLCFLKKPESGLQVLGVCSSLVSTAVLNTRTKLVEKGFAWLTCVNHSSLQREIRADAQTLTGGSNWSTDCGRVLLFLAGSACSAFLPNPGPPGGWWHHPQWARSAYTNPGQCPSVVLQANLTDIFSQLSFLFWDAFNLCQVNKKT